MNDDQAKISILQRHQIIVSIVTIAGSEAVCLVSVVLHILHWLKMPQMMQGSETQGDLSGLSDCKDKITSFTGLLILLVSSDL